MQEPSEGEPSLTEVWPLFGLRIVAGPLELRPVRDDDIPGLAALALAGIHPSEQMPFSFPWTDVPAADLPRRMAAFYWRSRAELSPQRWSIELAVRHDGVLAGVQAFSTSSYPVTRSGETGSWLGLAHQGGGLGTLMRQTLCAFLFDHLGAEQITSGAFADNPASRAVSRKVGYRSNGWFRVERRPGERAVLERLLLTPDALVRHGYDLHVEGVPAVRRLLGIDDA